MRSLYRLKAWLKWSLIGLFYRCVPRLRVNKLKTKYGVNLIGYANAEMGLGEALRNTAFALKGAHVPFLVRKLDVPLLNRQENMSMQAYMANDCRYGINCIGINPDMLYWLPKWLPYAEWGHRYNVGYWFWELANFPQPWRYASQLVDEVWVNTDFVADAVSQAHPKVFKIPFAVEFEAPDARYNRSFFDLPETGFLFLFSYDFNSSEARKNPQAVIAAFLEAFPDQTMQVALVVKSINGEQNPERLASLKAALQADQRVVWVDGYLTTEEMRGLLHTADAYVSLHRSEGLGLGMAESMYLGKPVIGTNYSGNTEFMHADNACLVSYELVPVKEGEYPYHVGQVWADPNIVEAAHWMQRLVDEPDFARETGNRAAAYMRKHHSRHEMGMAMTHRIEEIMKSQ